MYSLSLSHITQSPIYFQAEVFYLISPSQTYVQPLTNSLILQHATITAPASYLYSGEANN
jgi:hypothetical protein